MNEKTDINILFLAGGKKVSLAERFISAAKKKGRRANIFSYELKEDAPLLSIAKIIKGLKWDDKKIIPHLQSVIKKNRIHIVLPLVDPAIVIASRLKNKLPGNIFLPVSDETICSTFFDKEIANRWFVNNKFNVPGSERRLPLIAKPVKGSASNGILFIRDRSTLNFFDQNFNAKDYILQRCIEGEEFTVDCYIDSQGKILSVVPRKRIEVSSGEVIKTLVVKDNELVSLTHAVLGKSKLTGPVNVQIIREAKTRKLFLVEINPRFGGGVIATIEAGADIPLMILNEYLHLPNKEVKKVKENLLMLRAYREIFTYANHH